MNFNFFENSATILKMVVFVLMILALLVGILGVGFVMFNEDIDNIVSLYVIGGTIATEVCLLFMFVVADMAEDVSFLARNTAEIAEETQVASKTYVCPNCKEILKSTDIPKYSPTGVCPHCKQQFSKDNLIVR
ncbi:MAG: hypothetical protein IJ408_03080 [Clostridia bacterium]|nr:hypothetical protein [Clostridia bacterium]